MAEHSNMQSSYKRVLKTMAMARLPLSILCFIFLYKKKYFLALFPLIVFALST